MYTPSVTLFRQLIGPHVRHCRARLVKVSASPSRVYRIRLTYADGRAGPPTVMVKVIARAWPDDPHGGGRERRFYTQVLPRLDVPRPEVYAVMMDEARAHHLIVTEDLARGYVFHPPAHAWTPEEARRVLRTYARFHVAGRAALPDERAWLLPRYEARVREADIAGMAEELRREGVWGPLPRLPRLLARTVDEIRRLADQPVTLLHNDVSPANVGLPRDRRGDGVLVDWEMVGWGLPELDLAYMFTQPFRSAEGLDRARTLASYWDHRRALEGTIPSPAERRARQRHADAVLALWLVPVARRVAAHPFPAGSAPSRYWGSMFEVLYQRLRELSRDL
jgi:hypothetical protein